MAQYITATEIDPAYSSAYASIGGLSEELGQLAEAVSWYRKAVALDPGQPSHPRSLGFLYLDLGDPNRTEYWFKRQKELAPDFFLADGFMEPLYLYRGEEAKALDVGRKTFLIFPEAVQTLAHLRNHDLTVGRYAEARVRYELAYPALLNEDEPTIDDSNVEAAIDLALVLTRTSEQERAEMLLDNALTFLQSSREDGDGPGISDVRIYALQGKTEAAVTALRQLIDQGWRNEWWFSLEHDLNLDSIRDEPEFQAMVEEIKADMAAQLAHVRAMEKAGELEPIPDLN
jgi:tetratricopeptide (TPR) repeat protein